MSVTARRCTTMHLIGDSHLLALGDRVFEGPGGAPCLTRTHYLPGFAASRLQQGDALDPSLYGALEHEGLIDGDGAPRHLLMTPESLAVAHASGLPQLPPVILISGAEIDVRSKLLQPLGAEFDVLLPAGSPFPGVRPEAQLVPLELLEERIAACLAGLEANLAYLLQAGFPLTFVLAAPPPTADDSAFERVNGYASPRRLHAKLVWLMNRALAAVCERVGAGLVDVAPAVTADGALRPEFELDGVHLGPRAVDPLLSELLRHVRKAALRCAHAPRYALLRDQSPASAPPTDPQLVARAAEFAKLGLTTVQLPPEPVAAIREQLEFAHDMGNRHMRLGWAGNTEEPAIPNVQAADPDAVLPAVHTLLYGPEAAATIRACLGRDFVVLNCRPVRSLPHADGGAGPQGHHFDFLPPGVIRAILYLTDIEDDCGPFEYVLDEAPYTVTGPAGTLLVFDADRLWHRGRPPERTAREVLDLVLAPRAAGAPQVVISAGLNNWPSDPFCVPLPQLSSTPNQGNLLQVRPEPAHVLAEYAPPRLTALNAEPVDPAPLQPRADPASRAKALLRKTLTKVRGLVPPQE